jgi:hypothetical protein
MLEKNTCFSNNTYNRTFKGMAAKVKEPELINNVTGKFRTRSEKIRQIFSLPLLQRQKSPKMLIFLFIIIITPLFYICTCHSSY